MSLDSFSCPEIISSCRLLMPACGWIDGLPTRYMI
jgi:hypothetical protein